MTGVSRHGGHRPNYITVYIYKDFNFYHVYYLDVFMSDMELVKHSESAEKELICMTSKRYNCDDSILTHLTEDASDYYS